MQRDHWKLPREPTLTVRRSACGNGQPKIKPPVVEPERVWLVGIVCRPVAGERRGGSA
jgi:hypothetical protein